ncbi:hypothetical protein EON65_40240 [archaeon]|nr:MAG: hypothetical protein EON65_40240 [archaeon]
MMDYRDSVPETSAFADQVQNESMLKERTLARIKNAMKRDRSDSVVSQTRSIDRVDEEEENDGKEDVQDVREELFEALHEPFYQVGFMCHMHGES